jgi:hypothetical protein
MVKDKYRMDKGHGFDIEDIDVEKNIDELIEKEYMKEDSENHLNYIPG